ncbi:hypothetical protein [Microbacterium sp. lyk4-40-TSB-66]|uniref:hypothetical protein n=1 Tax=Microbacterium sp. lyk4-40-TSB-66 TaxID=3040294 RepID=UPI0033061228
MSSAFQSTASRVPDATTFRIGSITSENATSLSSIQSGHSPDSGRRYAPSINS